MYNISKIFHFKNYIKILKFITLGLAFSSGTVTLYAYNSKDFLKNSFNKVFTNLSSIPLVSYKVTFTTLEANKSNVTSSYCAEVFEFWDLESFFSVYQFSDKQLFISYQNNLGLERFWFGKLNDLPELKAKEVDNKILTTAIPYSSFIMNPLWSNIPIDSKSDQGFLVIQTYNKNKHSSYIKVEYYINKDYIPVRILYYNSISNFPIMEVLVTNYKYINNHYFIYKLEYRDNSSKKVTIVEKNEVNFSPSEPNWLESLKHTVKDNINEYYTSFLLGIRNEQDIKNYLSKAYIHSNTQSTLNSSKSYNDTVLNNKEKDNTTQDSTSSKDLLKLQSSKQNTLSTNNNDELLKALDELSSSKDYNKTITDPTMVKRFSNLQQDNSKAKVTNKSNKDLNVTIKKNSIKKAEPKVNNDSKINRKNYPTIPKNKLNYKDESSNSIELKHDKVISEKLILQNKPNSHLKDQAIESDKKDSNIEKIPPVKKESGNKETYTNGNNLLNSLF